MSWLRFTGLDRFSPFTRSPPEGSTTVSDADFSYITNDDLKKHAAQINADEQEQRNADILRVREGRNVHSLSFPAHAILRGDVRVADVRQEMARQLRIRSKQIELHYRGRKLADDAVRCVDLGLKHGSEILGSVDDSVSRDSASSDEADPDSGGVQLPSRKKKKSRGSKNKKKRQAGGTSTPEVLDVPPMQQRIPSPARPIDPLKAGTAQEKLNALFAVLRSYDQDVQAFLESPPASSAKRDFEHKRLSETILTQVLLKTDAVETDGDADARARRKELVKETQDLLKSLDEANGIKS